MRDSIYRISLDIHNVASQVQITAKQYDSARKIYITLTENGKPYIPEKGSRAIIMIDRPGSTVLNNNCYITYDGIVEYEFNDFTAYCTGTNECEIRIKDSSGNVITSPRFTMNVDANVYEDGQLNGVNHKTLVNRSADNSHPISAITGLGDLLSEKAQASAYESLNDRVEEIASSQIPQAYVEASVDEYITNNSAGLATKAEVESIRQDVSNAMMKRLTVKIGYGYPNSNPSTWRILISSDSYRFGYLSVKKGVQYHIKHPSGFIQLKYSLTETRPVSSTVVNIDAIGYVDITSRLDYTFIPSVDGYLMMYTKSPSNITLIEVSSDEYVPELKYPTLTDDQKNAMKSLINSYFNNRSIFYYDYNHNRNLYIDSGMYSEYKNAYAINCVGFVQMIMMGRSINDFIDSDGNVRGELYTGAITKEFDFGHYANFKYRPLIGSVAKYEDGKIVGYYGFVNPNKDYDNYVGSYSYNTYYSTSVRNRLYNQNFNTYMNANDLAFELHEMGCEIPYEELDSGDLVFFKHYYDNEDTNFFNSNICYRNISHVGIVYGKNEDGSLIIAESSGTSVSNYAVTMVSTGYSGSGDRTRATYLQHNLVMCARMPVAFGYSSNVPEEITYLPNGYGN